MPDGAPHVSAVMPCLNEEETLALCIKKAQRAFQQAGVVGEVVVGDNGSTDRSVEIALGLGARVAHQPIPGYGAALQAGIRSARGRYLVMADADDSYDWESLMDFVRPLQDGADLVMGNRFRGGIESGAMPPLHRYLGNPVLSFLARFVHNVPIGDFHCGMRSFTSQAFRHMSPNTEGFEFATEMVVRASNAGLKIEEVPTRLSPDGRSRPPHIRALRDGWRHLRYILTYAPNTLFLVPGVALLLLGAPLLALLAAGPVRTDYFFMGTHFLALGSMLSLVGVVTICLGIVARVAVWMDHEMIDDPLVKGLVDKFSPDLVLGFSAALGLLGIGTDVFLLWRRLAVGGSMDQTMHMAFVATTVIAAAAIVFLSTFLLHLLLQNCRKLRLESNQRAGDLLEESRGPGTETDPH